MKLKAFILFVGLNPLFLANAYDVESEGIYYNLIEDGTALEVTSYEEVIFTDIYHDTPKLPEKLYSGNINIPESVRVDGLAAELPVKGISVGAFYKCTQLESVTFPPTIESIGMHAFGDCSSLKSLDLGHTSVIEVPICMCRNCSALTEIILPLHAERIETAAFMNAGLKSIKLPDSMLKLGDGAFRESELERIDLGSSLCYIGHSCFVDTKLSEIKWSNSIKTIDDFAFSNTYIKNVYIPETIKSFGVNCFGSILGLQSVTILSKDPDKITFWFPDRIEDDNGCDPNITPTPFGLCDLTDCVLYVPEDCVEKYANSRYEIWSYFGKIEGIKTSRIESNMNVGDGISTVRVVQNSVIVNCEPEQTVTICDMMGREIANDFVAGERRLELQAGLYIVAFGNGRTFKVSVK